MERPEFTDEERALILAVASGSDSKLERILGHLPWIAPGIAFIIYGALSGQLHARHHRCPVDSPLPALGAGSGTTVLGTLYGDLP